MGAAGQMDEGLLETLDHPSAAGQSDTEGDVYEADGAREDQQPARAEHRLPGA
jgi:hypothetical protein